MQPPNACCCLRVVHLLPVVVVVIIVLCVCVFVYVCLTVCQVVDSGAVTVLRECLLENNHNMRKYAAAIAAIAASCVDFVLLLLSFCVVFFLSFALLRSRWHLCTG